MSLHWNDYRCSKANGMGIATSFVMVLSTVVTYPLYNFILLPLGLEFLQTLTFILVIASLVQLVGFYLKNRLQPCTVQWVYI